MKPWSFILAGVLIGCCCGAILLISQPERGVPITLSTSYANPYTLPKPTATSVPIQVLIKGEIVNPGTYALDRSQVGDLIEMVGGLTEKADAVRINDAFFCEMVIIFTFHWKESIPETARNAPGNNPLTIRRI